MRRSWTVGLLVWLGVVVVASALTWTVINSAGDQVLTDSAPVPLPAAAPEPSQSMRPSPSMTRSPAHHRGAAGANPSRATPPAASQQPRRSRTATGSAAGTQASRPGGRQARTAAPLSHDSTWHAAPGSVTVGCTGSRSSLVSATPNDGYRVEVGGPGPGEVEVTFKGDGRQTQVQALCSSSAARFTVESDSTAPGDE